MLIKLQRVCCIWFFQGLLKIGDVILEVNGVPVTSPEQLQHEVVKARGDGLQLKVGSPLVDKPVPTGRQVDENHDASPSTPIPSTSAAALRNNTSQNKTNSTSYKAGNLTVRKSDGQKHLVSCLQGFDIQAARSCELCSAPQNHVRKNRIFVSHSLHFTFSHFETKLTNSTKRSTLFLQS